MMNEGVEDLQSRAQQEQEELNFGQKEKEEAEGEERAE